jgi:hypothetical protein
MQRRSATAEPTGVSVFDYAVQQLHLLWPGSISHCAYFVRSHTDSRKQALFRAKAVAANPQGPLNKPAHKDNQAGQRHTCVRSYANKSGTGHMGEIQPYQTPAVHGIFCRCKSTSGC